MKRYVLAFCLATLIFSAAIIGAEQVTFTDGAQLIVDRSEVKGGVVQLHLQGGGFMAVPKSRVLSRIPWTLPLAPQPATEKPSTLETLPFKVKFSAQINSISAEFGLDPRLVATVVYVESRFKSTAKSPKGAMGLMQLMPNTAKRMGTLDPWNPEQNLRGGVKYLSWLIDRYGNDLSLALAAYNAGEGAVDKYNGIPPYRETKNYVAKILALLEA